MFERYAKHYNRLYRNKDYKRDVEFIYKWAGKPTSLLDIGCGTASYWQYFPVLPRGIEKSKDMVSHSRYKKNILLSDVLPLFSKPTIALGSTDMPLKGGCSPKKASFPLFPLVTALFDVINYFPNNRFWGNLPIQKGGYFIFDIWDKKKADKEGFQERVKKFSGGYRIITPKRTGNRVDLFIMVNTKKDTYTEKHTMYLYSEKQLLNFCGKEFEIVGKKSTDSWQTWYKLRRL